MSELPKTRPSLNMSMLTFFSSCNKSDIINQHHTIAHIAFCLTPIAIKFLSQKQYIAPFMEDVSSFCLLYTLASYIKLKPSECLCHMKVSFSQISVNLSDWSSSPIMEKICSDQTTSFKVHLHSPQVEKHKSQPISPILIQVLFWPLTTQQY